MTIPQPGAASEGISDALRDAMPSGELLCDDAARRLYSQDVFTRAAPAGMVLRPGELNELEEALSLLHAAGIASIPRGGGMSYTGGLVPDGEDWAVIDLGLMNRVLEVNRQDMTVTVECGCTWKSLYEALADTGLRTPYWGTLSGIRATVGGGLSQNAIFWGSGQHGSAVDSVISLTVVLADGTRIETGSAAQSKSDPFFRHFGPDLTGLFCSDSGAFGVKAHATLRLVPQMPAREYLAFDFAKAKETIAAMSDISRTGLASECFGFDPFLQQQRLKRQSMSADVKALAGVMKASGSLMSAMHDGAKLAIAGRRYMNDVNFSVQIIVEDRIAAGAADKAAEIRAICQRHNGREIENSIPKITRANPFGPVNSMLGPEGERWLPVHGLVPHSRFQAAYDAVEAIFDQHRERSDALGVGTGYLLATVSTHCCVLEPVFFWPDELLEIHEDAVEPGHLKKLPRHAPNPEAFDHVNTLRTELIALFSDIGAVHLQIGRSYNYRGALKNGPAQLVDALKQVLDGKSLMNPGSLGLE
ncbi:FAD binding domain protein [gamma proteobacterium NOR5-3]|nr:FAD binding domain protein [gamma proteobacterium NOR5-3]